MSQLCIVSGGALGADAYWTEIAALHDCRIDIVSFEGHDRAPGIPSWAHIFEVPQSDLAAVKPALESVSALRQVPMPVDDRAYSLVARNYFIANNIDALYAVGFWDPQAPSLGVEGGTGWTCELYARAFPSSYRHLFLFDMRTDEWLTYKDDKWVPAQPTPIFDHARVGVVGSRDISLKGKAAIAHLFKNGF